jgi:hypothetical protein
MISLPRSLLTFCMFVAALPFQACGGGAGTCNVTNSAAGYNYCINYLGSSFDTGSIRSACAALSGTYSSSACATASGGTCDYAKGTATETEWYFTGGGAGSASLQQACTAGGGTYAAGSGSPGADGGGGGTGSCSETTNGLTVCLAYLGSSFTAATVQASCSSQMGTYTSGPCAAATYGTCDVGSGTSTETLIYFGAGFSAATAQSACTSASGNYGP